MASLMSSKIGNPPVSMSIETKAALDRLLRRYLESCQRASGSLPIQKHDPAGPSECQVGEPDAHGMVRWRPRERDSVADFSGLERALELEIHPDIKSFYGSYWCGTMELTAMEGGVTLIQIWNDDDFDRLVGNILGHALAKRRIEAPLTIFIACADEDEFMLSVENETGRVVLENPGSLPIRGISPSLAEFLDRLQPLADSDR
jgi:SecY interacting protein Syd